MESKSEDRNLVLYFIIAFAFSWAFWIPRALIAQGLSAPPIVVNFLFGPFQPAAFGPLVAAFFLTYWNERMNGVKTLLKRAVDLRFGKVWLIPTILLLPLITGGALLLAILSGEALPDLFWTSNPLVLVGIFVYMLFLGGPVEEEFGWRGYALDRLQAKWNALISSVILGFIWGLWHLPLFFGTEEEIIYQTPIWGLVVTTILLTILMTWVYNNTGGSLLPSLLMHTMFIMSTIIFPAIGTELGGLYYFILFIVAVAVVLVIWRPRRMMRETVELPSTK